MTDNIQFRVYHPEKKTKYYSGLDAIANDWTEEEMKFAYISVIYRCVVVGQLNTESVINELY